MVDQSQVSERIATALNGTEISKEVATAILRARGWDEIGADVIIEDIETAFGKFTVEITTIVAEDYEDR